MSAALMETVSWVGVIERGVRSEAPQRTREPVTKLVPLMVSVKANPPTVVDGGLRLAIVGTGLGPVTVRVATRVMPP
jgi:hypothetical protein